MRRDPAGALSRFPPNSKAASILNLGVSVRDPASDKGDGLVMRLGRLPFHPGITISDLGSDRKPSEPSSTVSRTGYTPVPEVSR